MAVDLDSTPQGVGVEAPEVMMGEVPETVAPQSLEEAIAQENSQSTDYESFSTEDEIPNPDSAETYDVENKGTWQRYAEVFNPWAQQAYDFSLVAKRPAEESRDWDPTSSDWYKGLTPDQKAVVYDAPTLDYAETRLRRQGSYDASMQSIQDDSLWTKIPMGLATSLIAPETLIPGGFVFRQAKNAYSLGGKLKDIAQISATSALAASAGATVGEGVFAGTGATEADYLQANLWAIGIGGGLPIVGKVMSSSYNVGKTAGMLAESPKEFAVLSGQITLDKIPQARTWYNKFAPEWAQSDVMITAASDNPYVTMISNRIDSPSVAMVDRATGKPTKVGTTGQDFKIQQFGKMNLWKTDMNGHRQEAMENGWSGSYEDYQMEIGRLTRDRANRQEMAVYQEMQDQFAHAQAQMKADLKAEFAELKSTMKKKEFREFKSTRRSEEADKLKLEREKIRNDLYDTTQLEFDTQNVGLRNGAQRTADFFDGMRQTGVDLGSLEMKGVSKGRHYMTRIFDFAKVRDMPMEDLLTRLRRGLAAHPANQSEAITGAKLDAMAKDMATQLRKLDYDRQFADFSFFVPEELGMTSFLQSRKYKIDERELLDILDTNMEDVMGQYMYKQSGHYAALKSFPELRDVPLADQASVFREQFIEPLRKHAMDNNQPLKESEMVGLENMFEDMLGMFRIASNGRSPGWKAARLLNGWNSLTYGGGFALNTAAETGALLLQGSTSNLFKARMAPLKEIGTMFSNKRVDDPLIRDFILAGQMDQLFEYKGMMRMADTEGVFNADKIDKVLQDTNAEWYKYNGLRPATTALEMFAAPKVVHDLLDFGAGKMLGTSNEKYLARIGLDLDEAKKISDLMHKHGTFENGKIVDMGLDQWHSDEMADALVTAIGRGVRHTVIKGDTTYLPNWLINPNGPMGPFTRMVTNFLRYPIAANETLLARGFDEHQGKWAASILTSAMMMGSVLYLREQAALAVGALDEKDAKYDGFLDDDDKMMNLINATMTKVGSLGATSIAYEKMMVLSGTPMPGTTYVGNAEESTLGPGFARLSQFQDIMGALTTGDFQSKQMWYGIKGMTPFMSYPILNEASSQLIRDKTY